MNFLNRQLKTIYFDPLSHRRPVDWNTLRFESHYSIDKAVHFDIYEISPAHSHPTRYDVIRFKPISSLVEGL